MMKVLQKRLRHIGRLLREILLPLTLAGAWTFYSHYSASRPWTLADWGNIFGPAFFILAYFTNQYFRVKKQALTEESFQQIIATITGGDSFPIVAMIVREIGGGDLPAGLHLSPQGACSIYDLVVIVTNVERLRALTAAGNPIFQHQYQDRYVIGTIGRGYEEELEYFNIAVQNSLKFTFHIESFARNGHFQQRLLLRKHNQHWFEARRILHNGEQVYEHVANGFPAAELADLAPDQQLL